MSATPNHQTPLEDFFRKPDTVAVRLSPNGLYIAFMKPYERRLNVFVRELATGEETRITSATARDIAGYVWASDNRLLYAQDSGGDENYRLYAVDRDGSNPLDLTPFPDVQCTIVDDLEDVDDEILFQMNKRVPEVFDVYRLNTRTGDMSLAAENPGNVSTWHTDHDGKLRVATTTDGVNTSILHRPDESSEWRSIATYDFKESASPLFFTFDNASLYVSTNVGRDRAVIATFDVETGTERDLIFEHDEVDVSALLSSRKRQMITGVAYEVDRPERHFFDAETKRIHSFLEQQLPGYSISVQSRSKDETRWIIQSWNDRSTGSYHVLDVDSMTLDKLFDLMPWLDESTMAPMEPIAFTSRDGLHIRGYLTRPVGAVDIRAPLIINPHGGPWARDSWGYNPELQFLASRGYAVLQVNFRGSTGFGRAFMEASFGQWGLAMQDDITDAALWAIDEGIADPDRIAIYGGSYGGYATLAGLTKTPELYCCGIDYVGVSSLFTFMESIPPYWKPFLEMIHEMVGHPERDHDRMHATSPIFNIDRIAAPLFVAQGANDPRVKKSESDQIVDALRARGVAVEYMVKDNEGHGFHNEENMFEFYRHVERFLAEHMSGTTSTAPSETITR